MIGACWTTSPIEPSPSKMAAWSNTRVTTPSFSGSAKPAVNKRNGLTEISKRKSRKRRNSSIAFVPRPPKQRWFSHESSSSTRWNESSWSRTRPPLISAFLNRSAAARRFSNWKAPANTTGITRSSTNSTLRSNAETKSPLWESTEQESRLSPGSSQETKSQLPAHESSVTKSGSHTFPKLTLTNSIQRGLSSRQWKAASPAKQQRIFGRYWERFYFAETMFSRKSAFCQEANADASHSLACFFSLPIFSFSTSRLTTSICIHRKSCKKP